MSNQRLGLPSRLSGPLFGELHEAVWTDLAIRFIASFAIFAVAGLVILLGTL